MPQSAPGSRPSQHMCRVCVPALLPKAPLHLLDEAKGARFYFWCAVRAVWMGSEGQSLEEKGVLESYSKETKGHKPLGSLAHSAV